MLVNGKQVALTTGSDVEGMKQKLHDAYFHLPDSRIATRKPKKKRSRR